MRRILIAGLLAFTAVALFAAPADAQKAKAKKEFDKGVAAMESHDYKTALDHFQTAYDAAPHWMVLAHIGNCHAKLNDPVQSIKAYEQFLKDGGDDIDPEQRTAARANLEEQRKKVGALQLLVKPKESEVTIDGEKLGNPPFDEILLVAGPHHILVVRGEEEVEQDFTIEAGKEKMLKIYPKDDAVAAVVAAPVAAPVVQEPAPPPPAPKNAPAMVEDEAAPYMEPEPAPYQAPAVEPAPPPPPAEGTIRIAANVEGATIELDGTAEGTLPFEKPVAAGEHQITVASVGYLSYSETITVTGGMVNEINVSLVSESEVPNRINTPFIITASLAGAGLVTGTVGWVLFGYNNKSANNYENALKDFAAENPGTSWSWESVCADHEVTTNAEAYFCNTEASRQDYKDKARVGLGLGVAGTVLFAASGTMAALLFAKPEWFFSAESKSEMTLVPVATDDQMGLVLSGSF
jgi:hypothetical protein